MRIVLIFAALAASACSPLSSLNAVTRERAAEIHTAIAYGDHHRHRLDLYRTKVSPSNGLVVFFYGGGWTWGARQDFRFVTAIFNKNGFDVAIPDYRLYPEVRFPAFVEDAAAAVAYLSNDAQALDLNLSCLLLAGHSAGAHLAAMLVYDERYLARLNAPYPDAWIGLSGPYDFLPLSDDLLKQIFYPPEDRPASQPVNFVDGAEAPGLIIHGEDDDRAWPRNSYRLQARVDEAGGEIDAIFLPGVGHRRTALALSPTFRFVTNVSAPVEQFLQATARRCAATSKNDS